MLEYRKKKKLFQTNRIYLIPAFYPSFTPAILPLEYRTAFIEVDFQFSVVAFKNEAGVTDIE